MRQTSPIYRASRCSAIAAQELPDFHHRLNHPSVVYDAPCGCYLIANWGMGCDWAGNWFTRPSYLGFWTAPAPWGPWIQVHEEEAWTPAGDPGARACQPQIAPKWIAQDGRSFWLVWTDFQLVDDKRPCCCFNLQKVELLIA